LRCQGVAHGDGAGADRHVADVGLVQRCAMFGRCGGRQQRTSHHGW
jgi:hypothetical protein